jgi:hypothetical protein
VKKSKMDDNQHQENNSFRKKMNSDLFFAFTPYLGSHLAV